tara:strand:- start:401 stop:892 length:492 start_codon:yes stop_codon:yes gene_type:complete
MSHAVAYAEIKSILKAAKRVNDKTLLEVAQIALKETLGDRLTAEVTMESEFVADLDADSLDLVELVMFLEECFGIEIPDEYSMDIVTVGDAIEVIKKCKKEAGKPRKKVDKAALLKKKPNPKGPIGASAVKLQSSVPADLEKRIDEAIAESDREESENDSEAG